MTKRQFIKKERLRVFNLKIGLEKTMRRDLKSYFAKQRKKVRNNEDVESIEPVLEKHYKRIARRLIHKNIKQVSVEEGATNFINGVAQKRAMEINRTTLGKLDDAQRRAVAELAKDGNTNPSARELSIMTSAIFHRLNQGRISIIANTETQTVTEGLRSEIVDDVHLEMEDVILNRDSKRAEELYNLSQDYTSYTIKENIEILAVPTLLSMLGHATKMWQTMGDSLVRTSPFNHQEANGQTVPKDAAYMVSGQFLNYPGDTSLGASPGNTINCRCVSVYL